MTTFSKFITPLHDRGLPTDPTYYSNALGGNRQDTCLRVNGASYMVMPVSHHEVKVGLRPRIGPNDVIFFNLSNVEPDPSAIAASSVLNDLPVLLDSNFSPSHGLADPAVGAPVLSGEDLIGAQVSQNLVDSLGSGSGKVALIKNVFFGQGSLGDLDVELTYDLDNPEERAQLLSKLPREAEDWVDLMLSAYSDGNATQMIALLDNAAAGEAGILEALVGPNRGTSVRTPAAQVPPRVSLIARNGAHTLEYVHGLGRVTQPAPTNGTPGSPSTIHITTVDPATEAANQESKVAAAKYAVFGSDFKDEEGVATHITLGTLTERYTQLLAMNGNPAKRTALREMYTCSKTVHSSEATVMSSCRFGDDLSTETADQLLKFHLNTHAFANADSSSDLSSFSIIDLSARPAVVRMITKSLLAAEDSGSPSLSRARASVGTEAERMAFFADPADVRRVCANIERALGLILKLDTGVAARLLKNVRKVFSLVNSDRYLIWWQRPTGGKKCPFANAQLVFYLDQYACALVKCSRNPLNYAAGARGDVSTIDLSPATKAERVLERRLNAYDEAIENNAPVKMTLPGLIPNWLLAPQAAGATPPSVNFVTPPIRGRNRRDEGTDREDGATRPRQRARFSDIGIGGLSAHGNTDRRSSGVDRARFGTHVRVGRASDMSVFPVALRPPNRDWEKFAIVGETSPDLPVAWRRTWPSFSDEEQAAMIDYVRANRSHIALNADNHRVAATLRNKGLTNLMVSAGSAEQRG